MGECEAEMRREDIQGNTVSSPVLPPTCTVLGVGVSPVTCPGNRVDITTTGRETCVHVGHLALEKLGEERGPEGGGRRPEGERGGGQRERGGGQRGRGEGARGGEGEKARGGEGEKARGGEGEEGEGGERE